MKRTMGILLVIFILSTTMGAVIPEVQLTSPVTPEEVTSMGLLLSKLSLPPEVISEALFSQVDSLQDLLEQCEETVRNQLKGDSLESSISDSDSDNSISADIDDFFAGRNRWTSRRRKPTAAVSKSESLIANDGVDATTTVQGETVPTSSEADGEGSNSSVSAADAGDGSVEVVDTNNDELDDVSEISVNISRVSKDTPVQEFNPRADDVSKDGDEKNDVEEKGNDDSHDHGHDDDDYDEDYGDDGESDDDNDDDDGDDDSDNGNEEDDRHKEEPASVSDNTAATDIPAKQTGSANDAENDPSTEKHEGNTKNVIVEEKRPTQDPLPNMDTQAEANSINVNETSPADNGNFSQAMDSQLTESSSKEITIPNSEITTPTSEITTLTSVHADKENMHEVEGSDLERRKRTAFWDDAKTDILEEGDFRGGRRGEVAKRRFRRHLSATGDPKRYLPLISRLVDRFNYLKRSLIVCRRLLDTNAASPLAR